MTSAGHPDYAKAMALYRSSFPEHELREEASQEKIMGHPQYHFDGVYDGDCWAGLILYWETEKFLYVEHFCIFPELRGRKYGQRALEKLNEKGEPTAKKQIDLISTVHVDENTKDQPDGNNVDVDSQSNELAKVQLQYQALKNQMNGEFTRLRSAMKTT